MKDILQKLTTLLKTDRRAVTAVEYAIIAGVVALVIVVAFASLGNQISNTMTNVTSAI